MTWTRLDDTWVDKPQLEDLDYADRWHYLAMIQFCCRNDRTNGVIRNVDARRCSDHPNPAVALANIAAAGLIDIVGKAYRLVEIDAHVAPPWVAKKQERDKLAQRRSRAHKAGDHGLCIFGSCPDAPRPDDNSDDGHDDCHDDSRDGTGRVGTGSYTRDSQNSDAKITSWPVAEIGKAS